MCILLNRHLPGVFLFECVLKAMGGGGGVLIIALSIPGKISHHSPLWCSDTFLQTCSYLVLRIGSESWVFFIPHFCFFFLLRNIAKLRNMLPVSDAENLVHAFMTSRLDYCNALLGACPASSINKLQITIQVYLYSAFYDTIVGKAALQEIKLIQYIYIL